MGKVFKDEWVCVNRKFIGIYDSSNSTLNHTSVEYEIPGPGIYAVILRPNPDVIKDSDLCGFVCKHKGRLLITFFLSFPTLTICIIVIYKMYIFLY